jgi:hypothetical protein
MRKATMAFEIGELNVEPAAAGARALAETPRAATVDTSEVVPASPPPEVLAEVDAAWERAAQLAAENRELHFTRDASGRVVIEVRTLNGEVLRTIPPSRALDVTGGGAL